MNSRPLIEYTFETAIESKKLSRVILSTDTSDIVDCALRFRIEIPFIRPAEFSTDTSPANEYIYHCLDFLAENEDYAPEVIVILQPTSPFRNASDIDSCIDLLLESECDSVVSVTELNNKYNPEWQFIINSKGWLHSYTNSSWNKIIPRRQDLVPTYTRNGAVYTFWRSSFLKNKNIYGKKIIPYIMPTQRSVNIDDMKDWERAENIIRSR